jgi:hypothetical protein
LLLSSTEAKSVHTRNAASDGARIESITTARSVLLTTANRYAALRETRH